MYDDARSVRSLVRLALAKGVRKSDLEDAIAECLCGEVDEDNSDSSPVATDTRSADLSDASYRARAVTKGGLHSQIAFLLCRHDSEVVRDIILNAAENKE